jgi:hypothetical protein
LIVAAAMTVIGVLFDVHAVGATGAVAGEPHGVS